MYDGRRAALDAIIADMLIAQAAKAKNMTPEALRGRAELKRARSGHRRGRRHVLSVEHQSDAGAIARTDVAGDHPLPQDQQKRRGAASLIAELRKAGPDVRMLLDAPRADD